MAELVLQVLDSVHIVTLVDDALQSLALIVLNARHVLHFFLQFRIPPFSLLELIFQLNNSAEALLVFQS